MEYEVIRHPHHLEINMSGQFTFNYNQKFKQLVSLLDNEGLEFIRLNLAGVAFIDSAGLGMLLLMRDRCLEKSISITLQGAQGQVEKILELSKFDQLFSIAS